MDLSVFFADQVPLHLHGRTGSCKRSVALFWTASGFSADCTAGELWACLEGGWSVSEPWVSVWVNGSPVSRFIVQKGKNWYCLFRGLPQGKRSRIMLLKETQAMSSDAEHGLYLHALGVPSSCGNNPKDLFRPVPRYRHRIAFIGDSITTGEGLAGGTDELDWISGWMSLRSNYALMTAQSLDADFHVLSQSGWGIVTGWDNDRNCALPKHVDAVCSLAYGAKNRRYGSLLPWDSSSWKADAVVINLGTNDWNAFNSPAKKNADGTEWKLHLADNGKPCAADARFLVSEAGAFLHKVRVLYPAAHIVWAYGMCGSDLAPLLRKAVSAYARESGDGKVCFMTLPSMARETDGERGSRQHPGPGTHMRSARALTEKLRMLYGEAQ